MEPAIKPAAQTTRSGVVGVLATSRTLASPSVARLCAAYGKDIEILLQPCPGLVEQVEKAQLHSDATRELLVGYLSPLLLAGADTIVLGCTHYPFLAPLIREIVGPDLTIIDPATAVAKELARRLQGNLLPVSAERAAEVSFFSSTAAEQASLIISALWGSRVLVQEASQLGHRGQRPGLVSTGF
jgi:glutamate racemase